MHYSYIRLHPETFDLFHQEAAKHNLTVVEIPDDDLHQFIGTSANLSAFWKSNEDTWRAVYLRHSPSV